MSDSKTTSSAGMGVGSLLGVAFVVLKLCGQLKYQMRHDAIGLCRLCCKPIAKDNNWLCREHTDKQAERYRLSRIKV